ncbi:MAG: DMT family transporter [Euryarchaeota archaeon]|nr:DMT family transporter [Euryarchaeota archaeon]
MLYLILAALIWGTTPIAAKLAYAQGTSPLALVELRLATGALLFALYLRGFNAKLLSRELLVLALFGLAANFLFYHLAVKHTSAAAAQVLESTSVAFAALLAALLREEVLSQRKLFAVALSLAGSGLIFYSHAGVSLLGDALAILAALTWALFTVLASRTLRARSEEEVLLLTFTIAALALLPFASVSAQVSVKGAVIAVLMGVVHTFLAYLLYLRGIAEAKAVAATIAFALSPVVAIALSALLLREALSAAFYAGAALIIAGIALVKR